MFMNRVHEQCPKIDSGKIPSRTGPKTGRAHRVHNPRPARAPRPRLPPSQPCPARSVRARAYCRALPRKPRVPAARAPAAPAARLALPVCPARPAGPARLQNARLPSTQRPAPAAPSCHLRAPRMPRARPGRPAPSQRLLYRDTSQASSQYRLADSIAILSNPSRPVLQYSLLTAHLRPLCCNTNLYLATQFPSHLSLISAIQTSVLQYTSSPS